MAVLDRATRKANDVSTNFNDNVTEDITPLDARTSQVDDYDSTPSFIDEDFSYDITDKIFEWGAEPLNIERDPTQPDVPGQDLYWMHKSWADDLYARKISATELLEGTVQLATQAEVNAGVEDTKAFTSFKLATWWINEKTLAQTFSNEFNIIRATTLFADTIFNVENTTNPILTILGDGTFSLGEGATATRDDQVSIGKNTDVTGIAAIGINGDVSGQDSIGIGAGNDALRAIAMWSGSTNYVLPNTADFCILLATGTISLIDGDDSVIIGLNPDYNGANGVMIGPDNTISDSSVILIANGGTATGLRDVGMGQNIDITADDATLLGQGVTAGGALVNSVANSFAWGSESTTPSFHIKKSAETYLDDTTGMVIGDNTKETSAILELESTTGALLISRMTTTEKNALTPVNGMIVYDTTLNKFQGYENGAWTSFI